MSEINEIDYTLKQRASLTDNTKRGYANTYKRLRALLDKDVIDTEQDIIINKIDTAQEENKKTKELTDLTASVKLTLLNVAIVIRQVFNKPVNELEEYRARGKKTLLTSNVLHNEELKTIFPTLKQITDYTNELYEKGDYKKFVVNYLILTFNTRNMDLNLIITKDSKQITHKDNWIILLKDRARYVRYVYKTANSYDCKENEIKDKRVLDSLNNILGDKEQTPLLLNTNGERITEASLNKVISRMTFKNETYKEGLGQANYLKIILGEKTNMRTFEKVSANRGTSLKELNENYNTNFQNDTETIIKKSAKACNKIPDMEKGSVKKQVAKELKIKEIEQARAILKLKEEEEAKAKAKIEQELLLSKQNEKSKIKRPSKKKLLVVN